jgi:hypothetical protein
MPSGAASLDDVVGHLRRYPHRPDFLVEERLDPSPRLAAFAPGVVHTARIVTGLAPDGAEILAAALRIGLGRDPVDNLAKGNLVAPIDVGTGELGSATSKRLKGPRVVAHPVSKAAIAGVIVPDWEVTRSLVRAAAEAMPWSACLGWDVAFTTRGPILQETNDIWDPNVIQLAHDRGLLGLRLGRYLAAHGVTQSIGILPKGPGLRRRDHGDP